jgi:sugar/nucleoside kinase (ribokinase family)
MDGKLSGVGTYKKRVMDYFTNDAFILVDSTGQNPFNIYAEKNGITNQIQVTVDANNNNFNITLTMPASPVPSGGSWIFRK